MENGEMTNAWRFKLVLASLALAAGGATLWHLLPGARPVVSAMKSECAARADRFSATRTVRTYTIDYHSDSTSDLSRLFAAGSPKDQAGLNQKQLGQSAVLDVHAVWELTTYENNGRLISIGRLIDPDVTLKHNGAGDSAFDRQLKTDLQKPFMVELTTAGEVLELSSQKGLGKIQKNILRAIIAESQAVLPAEANAEWSTRERDANGFYEARYRQPAPATGDSLRIKKTKERYLDIAGKKSQRRSAKDVDFKTELEPRVSADIVFDCAQGTLSTLKTEGTVATRVNRVEIGTSQFTLAMKLRTISPLRESADLASLRRSNGLGGSRDGVEAYSVTATESAEAIESLIQKTELGELTAEKLLALLKAAQLSGKADAIQDLYLKFKALIYLHPEACGQIASLMKKENPQKSKAMLMLATALSTVGSPEAQAALVDVLQARSADVASAEILIPALGMTDAPSRKAEESLRDLIRSSEKEEIVSTAGLSLGAMAGHLADQDPDRSRAIVESVQKDYLNAENDQQKKYLLSVLGNAGASESLSLIDSALRSQNSEVQAEAAMALRFVPEREAQAKLVDLLGASGAGENVKQAAAAALSYREPTRELSQALQANFGSQSSEGVRRELIKAIYENRSVDPSVGGWLKNIAAHDQSPEVRKLAGDYAGQIVEQ